MSSVHTLTCPHCNLPTPVDFNYCINCDQQIKCKHDQCGSILLSGKSKCFKCGRPTDTAVTAQGQQNTFTHTVEEKGIGSKNASYLQKTEFRGSDFAVAHVGNIIAAHLSNQTPLRVNQAAYTTGIHVPNVEKNSTGNLFELQPPIKQIEPSIESPQPQQAQSADLISPEYQIAVRLFEQDGDVLIKKIKDFKGQSWSAQQKRFMLLYTFAYPHLVGKLVPKKEHFKIAAEKADIADNSNFAKYVEQLVKSDFLIKSDGVTLNSDGQKNVAQILAELDDSKFGPGEPYWSREGKPAVKWTRLSNDDKTRLEEWAREEVDLGQLSIVQILRAVDYALLAFWLLTVRSRKAETVMWNEAYHYLKARFPNVSSSPEAFSRAVSNSSNKDLFRQSQDGGYFLSEEACNKVQGWVDGKPINAGDAKGK